MEGHEEGLRWWSRRDAIRAASRGGLLLGAGLVGCSTGDGEFPPDFEPTPPGPGSSGWPVESSGGVNSPAPLPAEDRLHCPEYESGIHTRDLRTGALLWEVESADPGPEVTLVPSSPLRFGDSLLVATGYVPRPDTGEPSSSLSAYDPDTGRERWSVPFPKIRGMSLASVHEGIMLASGFEGVYGLDPRDGSLVWASAPLSVSSRTLFVVNGTLVVLSDGNLVGLDSLTGSVSWKHPVGVNTHVAVAPEEEVAVATVDGYLHRDGQTRVLGVSTRSGETLWTRPNSGFAGGAAGIGGGVAVFAGGDTTLTGVDTRTGDELWSSRRGIAGASPGKGP